MYAFWISVAAEIYYTHQNAHIRDISHVRLRARINSFCASRVDMHIQLLLSLRKGGHTMLLEILSKADA